MRHRPLISPSKNWGAVQTAPQFLDGPFVFEARAYVAVRKLGRLEVVGGERVDELVEFLLLRLIVRVGLV